MKKETRKEKRAGEKDEKLADALYEYGYLTDRINALVEERYKASMGAKKLLAPGRIVKVGGYQYQLSGDGGLIRVKRAEDLDRSRPVWSGSGLRMDWIVCRCKK